MQNIGWFEEKKTIIVSRKVGWSSFLGCLFCGVLLFHSIATMTTCLRMSDVKWSKGRWRHVTRHCHLLLYCRSCYSSLPVVYPPFKLWHLVRFFNASNFEIGRKTRFFTNSRPTFKIPASRMQHGFLLFTLKQMYLYGCHIPNWRRLQLFSELI